MPSLIDPIHGKIYFSDFEKKIINRKEFQRLKNVKQLGVTTWLFPGATHTRFEHSLGVFYLAGKFLDILEHNSNVKIPKLKKQCVKIAGLLHDIGHGPFSHMWEDFVHMGEDKEWHHEETSCELVATIFNELNSKEISEIEPNIIGLIQALISGDRKQLKQFLKPEEMFLSEIISNSYCQIDVDKWDYIQRDIFYLKNVVSISTDFMRFFLTGRIVTDSLGETHISYHGDYVNDIFKLFEIRSQLHIEVYQHPFIAGIEIFLFNILISAERNGFELKGLKLSQAHRDPEVFGCLDDSIINIIETSTNWDLTEAKELIGRLKERKFYKIIDDNNCSNEVQTMMRNIKISYATLPKNLVLHNDKDNFISAKLQCQENSPMFYERTVRFLTI